LRKYVGPEADTLYAETESSVIDQQQAVSEKRHEKIKELKSICRFCFTKKPNTKYVNIDKLEAFSIDIIKIIELIGVKREYNSSFSDIICEECFYKVIEIESYRKKCQKSQIDLIAELQELDEKLQKFKHTDSVPWHKVELSDDANVADNCVVKVETLEDTVTGEIRVPEEKRAWMIRNFQCFFCHEIFTGRLAYKSHKCKIKQITCNVTGCGKTFTLQSSFNTHIKLVHGMQKITSYYCPVCQTYVQMAATDFEDHCKRCAQINNYKDKSIECAVKDCRKLCENLQIYAAHQMFHDTKCLITNFDSNGAIVSVRKPIKSLTICDFCGKSFASNKNLREHRNNVHNVNFKGEMFICDLCPTKKPSRRLMHNHMRNIHIINTIPCDICGKVFRTQALWQKHSLTHNAAKRKFFCEHCPHHKGFLAKSDYNRHIKSRHTEATGLGARAFQCDVGFCNASYVKLDNLNQHKIKIHNI
jgi:Zinc-finger associated domain (zf-AD)/C2H2-type zinc finger/Zinc finger, C2H2 type